jgi:uncharacterized phage-associated protein
VQSCFDVADYFIAQANQTGAVVNNLKLQKLVYYAQAWHLGIHGAPLFAGEFQAWVHGPVIPALYEKYKDFGWQPIQLDVSPDLPKAIVHFLGEVADEYLNCDVYELEQMIRVEPPWNRARRGVLMDEPSEAVVEKDWMKEHFSTRGQENPEDPSEAIIEYQLLV